MRLEDLIDDLHCICQLIDGWTAGNCSCGVPVPWSKFDEETKQKAHKLLHLATEQKEGRAILVEAKPTSTNSAMIEIAATIGQLIAWLYPTLGEAAVERLSNRLNAVIARLRQ